jgi:O-antigen ligase
MEIRPAEKGPPASCYAYLAALSLIFAYAVFESGGILPSEWKSCLVSLGLLALVYFRYTNKEDLAPPLQWWLRWPPLLLLGFVGIQLVPLPMWLLHAISPARAGLSQSLNQAFPGTVSSTISVYPSATLAHLFRVAAYTVVFVMARELAWRTRGRRWLVIAPVLMIAGAEAVLGVFQYSQDTAAHGTYVNRDHFAGLLELSLPFATVYPIAAMMTRRRQSFRQDVLTSISVALAALILLGIILSLSRTGFLASLCSLFVAGSLSLGARVPALRRFVAAALVAAVLIAASFYLAPDQLISRFGEIAGTSMDMMGNWRPRIWKDTWELITHYPLAGCGLGAFEQAFPRFRTFLPELAVDTVHNDYLQFLAELGAIGFSIVAFGMIAVFLSAAYAVFRSDSSKRYFAIASLGALIAILIHSFVDYNLYIPANAMLFAWIAGLVASLNFGSGAGLRPD